MTSSIYVEYDVYIYICMYNSIYIYTSICYMYTLYIYIYVHMYNMGPWSRTGVLLCHAFPVARPVLVAFQLCPGLEFLPCELQLILRIACGYKQEG